jgi:hypothetical protein
MDNRTRERTIRESLSTKTGALSVVGAEPVIVWWAGMTPGRSLTAKRLMPFQDF